MPSPRDVWGGTDNGGVDERGSANKGAWRDPETCGAAQTMAAWIREVARMRGARCASETHGAARMIVAWMRGAARTYNMVYTWNVLLASLALHSGCPLVLVAIIDACKVGTAAVHQAGQGLGISSGVAEAGREEVESGQCWTG